MVSIWSVGPRFFLIAALGTLALCAHSQTLAVKVKSKTGASGVWIVKDSQAVAVPDTEAWTPVSWSADGRWLALGKPTKGSLFNLAVVDTASATLIKLELNGDCSPPSWSPDGKRFVVSVSGLGLRMCNVAGSDPAWTALLPTGSMPAWSPTGGRIGFVGPKGGPGVWTVSDEGQGTRPIAKQPGAVSIAWAPDGRTLATVFTAKKGWELSLVSPGGQSKTLAPVESDDVAWSPNASSLVVKQHGQWSVLATKTGTTVVTGLKGVVPQWIDSKTLLSVQNGALVKCEVGEPGTSELFKVRPRSLPEGEIESVAFFRGLVLDGQFENPWLKSPPPKTGQIRLIGTVDDIDLTEDTAIIKVWSVMSPDRMELNLAKPLIQTVRVLPTSNRAGPNGSTRLVATDFQSDAEILLLVEGTKAGVSEALSIDYGVLPELAETVAPSDLALDHPTRTLDYDGVSMDTVVVPMLFPVVGKVNWSDSFLASRDGGSRRHHGQDLLAPKMRPLVASFDGVVRFNRSKAGHNTITLRGDTGWTVIYMHVNNDHPGTDDGQGGDRYAFAPGLHSGDRVVRGQLVGFCGDSGNAESTVPHCHFELHDDVGGGVLNASPSLETAEHCDAPICRTPPLDCELATGEVRWDFVVVKYDKDRQVVVGELISQGVAGRPEECVSSPRQVFVRLTPGTNVALRSDSKERRQADDLKPGSYVTAVGFQPQNDQAMEARFLGFGLSISQ